MCMVCKTVGALCLLVVVVLAIAALVGVYVSHSTPTWNFGSPDGSLAIIAAIAGVTVAKKMMRKMCPCGCSKSCGAGCGCGMANCNCEKPKM